MKKYKIVGKVLKILDGVTSICEADFLNEDVKNFADLEFVSLPNSLKRIEERAFFDHFVGVRRVDLKNVEHIGSMAFYGMASLKEIILTDKIKNIEKHAFCNCENLSIKVVCEFCLPKGWDEEFYVNVKSVEIKFEKEEIMSNKAQIEEMVDFWQKNIPNSQKTIENIKNKVFNEPEETMEYRFGQVLVSEIAEPLVQSFPNYKPNLAREKFSDEKLCKFFEVLCDFNKNFPKFFKQNFGGFDRFVKNEIISKTPLEKRIPLSWCVQIDEVEKIFEDFGDTQVCPVCGKYIFKSYGEICPLCSWENEGLFYGSGGANDDDVFSARKKYNLKVKTSPAHLWQNFRKKIEDSSKTDERIYEEKVLAFF